MAVSGRKMIFSFTSKIIYSDFQLNELEEAEDALMEANVLDNKDAEVWGYLSLVCLKTGRKVEAEQSYKYAIKVRVMSLLRVSRINKDLWYFTFHWSKRQIYH